MKNQNESLQNLTDERLVALAKEGNTEAVNVLLARYRGLVRSYARKYFLMDGETEDLIQEGMMGLYQAISDYKPKTEGGQSFKNFAHLCVSRRIIDAVRISSGKKNEPLNTSVSESNAEEMPSQGNPEDVLIFDDERRELNKLMAMLLSDMELRVFTMYMDGERVRDIVQITKISEARVENALQRSKSKLRKAYTKKG